MQRTLPTVLVLAILAATTLAATEELPRVHVLEPSVHLRSGPGVDHPAVDKLAKGEVLHVREREGNWYRVDREGLEGWVYAPLVSEPDAPVPVRAPSRPESGSNAGPQEGAQPPPGALDRLLRTSKGDLAVDAYEPGADYRAELETSMGKVVIDLWPEVAPNHVKNLLHLASTDFYDGLTFHRVIPGFLVQGGDPRGDGTGGPGYTIALEPGDRPTEAGVLVMARRLDDPHSAGSQFFILLEPRPWLQEGWTAFGAVIQGMDTLRRIAAVPTNEWDQPREPVSISDLRVVRTGPE